MLAALLGELLCSLERDEVLWGERQQGSGHLFPFQHKGNAWGAPEMHSKYSNFTTIRHTLLTKILVRTRRCAL